MKILAISDVHDAYDRFPPADLPDVDLALIAGDVTEFGVEKYDAEPAGEWMRAMTERCRLVYYIPGNHDRGVDNRTWERAPDNPAAPRCLGIDGLVAAAGPAALPVLGMSLSTCFDMPLLAQAFAYMTASREVDARTWQSAPLAAIVLAHSPPYGVCDQSRRGTHLGSPGLRAYIDRYQPRVVICGHVHEAAGVGGVGETLVVNAARAAVLLTLHGNSDVEWSVAVHHRWSADRLQGIWSQRRRESAQASATPAASSEQTSAEA